MDEITNKELTEIKGLVAVELYKPGCQPCEQLTPVLDKLSLQYNGKIRFYKSHFVEGGLGQHFSLKLENVPTIVLLKDGQLVETFPGAKYAQGMSGERIAAKPESLTRRFDKFIQGYYVATTGTPAQIGYNTTPKQDLETRLALSENSMITLRERYLMKDNKGNIIETPEDLFRRVAKNIAEAEKKYGKTETEIKTTENKFYQMIADLDFMPNSPTLMNAGRDLQQLSACFVLPIEDSIEGIFGASMQGAMVHKSGGGTGYSFSRIRPANSRVKSTSGVASGPVSFMYAFNVYTDVVKQGGTRRGANMGVLRVDHPDIQKFIHAKGELNEANKKIIEGMKEDYGLDDNSPEIISLKRKLLENTQLNNFNISVAITDRFMDAAQKNEDFELIDPKTKKVVRRIKARELFEEIVSQAWKTGDPGVIFIDRINQYNPTPHIGEIEATNPCGEQPLLPYESCNLGSINLPRFVKEGKIDYKRLGQVVHDSVHFLDNVIDMNKYPVKEIEEMTKANRKIGLGVMGFADLTTMLRIPYGSDESVKLGKEVMKFVRDEARKASIALAEQRGVFPNFKNSIYDSESKSFKGEDLKLRNATLTTIAPTGTISMIANCESGIEPFFSLAYTRTVMDGKVLHYRARGLEYVLREKSLDAEKIFSELEKGEKKVLDSLPDDVKKLALTAMQLNPNRHIEVQAAFQEYTDNAVSKTINMPAKATVEDIAVAYKQAYETGCKGITAYRDKSKDVQVLKEKTSDEGTKVGEKTTLPKERLGVIRVETVGDGRRIFVITGHRDSRANQLAIERLRREGEVAEFFVDSNYFDPKTHGLVTALAIRGSKDLQRGIPLDEIVQDLRDLPPSDEIGYDNGFGAGQSYVNRSIPDAIWKAISGWKPVKSKVIEQKEKTDKPGRNTKKKIDINTEITTYGSYGFCSNCHRNGVISRDGCVKCIHCGFSPKGCD